MKYTKRILLVLVMFLITPAAFLVSKSVIAATVPTDTDLQSYTNQQLVDVIQRASSVLSTRLATPTPTPTPTSTPTPTATPTPKPTVTPTPTPAPVSTTMVREAWVYPGDPACNAATEYTTEKVDTLKPEYLTLDSTGTVQTLPDTSAGCNGYSAANAQSIKSYSKEQYVTVSGAYTGMVAMVGNTTKRAAFVQSVTNFINQIGFTGADIDFEDYGQWTATDYSNYKAMIQALGTSLHASGKKLEIDLPPIGDASMQNYYLLKYEDFNALPVDEYTIMAYDLQYDLGAGSAVTPISWLNSIIDWSLAKFTDKSKIDMGIPSFGYQGTTGGYNITILTYDQAKTKPGFSTATRDADSQEMKWTNAGTSYFYSDATSLDAKLAAVKAKGLTHVSVWHLGGNKWFSN